MLEEAHLQHVLQRRGRRQRGGEEGDKVEKPPHPISVKERAGNGMRDLSGFEGGLTERLPEWGM